MMMNKTQRNTKYLKKPTMNIPTQKTQKNINEKLNTKKKPNMQLNPPLRTNLMWLWTFSEIKKHTTT